MRNTTSLPGMMLAARLFLLLALAGMMAAIVLIMNRSIEYDGAATILLIASTALICVAMLMLETEE